MAVLSVILALLLEQYRPIGRDKLLYRLYLDYASGIERHSNAGEARHGVVGWCYAVLPWVAVAGLGYWLLGKISWWLAWGWDVLVLYLTMGFRQFSHAFTAIAKALAKDKLELARRRLQRWTGLGSAEMPVEEVARVAIEQGLIDSYRYVFATVFWFVVLPGPTGPVLYRLSALLREQWGTRYEQYAEPFGQFAKTMLDWLDWLPIRLTAICFAIMGDFEDAVQCWREQARAWGNREHGILLAAGAGALGVRLGAALHQDHTVKFRPELGLGDDADPQSLVRAVGLIWRALGTMLLMMLLLLAARAL